MAAAHGWHPVRAVRPDEDQYSRTVSPVRTVPGSSTVAYARLTGPRLDRAAAVPDLAA